MTAKSMELLAGSRSMQREHTDSVVWVGNQDDRRCVSHDRILCFPRLNGTTTVRIVSPWLRTSEIVGAYRPACMSSRIETGFHLNLRVVSSACQSMLISDSQVTRTKASPIRPRYAIMERLSSPVCQLSEMIRFQLAPPSKGAEPGPRDFSRSRV